MEKSLLDKIPFINAEQKNKLIVLLRKLDEIDKKLPSENICFNYGSSGFRYNSDNLRKVANIYILRNLLEKKIFYCNSILSFKIISIILN